MRNNAFGTPYITSTDDDLGDAIVTRGHDPEDVYAVVDDDGTFEVLTNEDGEEVALCDKGVFPSAQAAQAWLEQWLPDVQTR